MNKENIYYDLTETNKDFNEYNNLDDYANEIMEDDNINHLIALELDYSNNYNLKQLGQIMEFYKLNKRKLNKGQIVEKIVLYETDPDNSYEVENRKRLWINIKELKDNPFFGRYILFNV